MTARPFVKWVGGKRQLVDAIAELLPAEHGRIYEPFAGGGALFFARRPARAVLGDANADLINAYASIRDDVEAVIAHLREHARLHSREHYYAVRARLPSPDPGSAARLIYLNKAGFNGLYRVNKKGQFNVPLGKFKSPPTILDEANLRACSVALQGVELRVGDFEATVADAVAGDVVYFDPPYVPVSATSSFTSYAVDGFGDADQRRLAALVRTLSARGVTCIASNSDAPRVRELYADCELVEVSRAGTVSSKATKRGRVGELLIRRAAARVEPASFDIEPRGPSLKKAYSDFIAHKSQLDNDSGFAPVWMPGFLFDFQSALVDWAVRKGKAAIFADCGLGKTPMQLVWSENVVRKTNKPVLIVTPLAVSAQTVREAEKFGIGCRRTSTGEVHAGINVTNYERLHYLNPNDFAGVVLDESSAIKHFTGARQRAVTAFLRHMPYRLLCTATAAPNDYIELGTSAEALGQLGRMDMLGMFFHNDEHSLHPIWWGARWRFKRHAETIFWRWVSSWARAVRRPSDLGFQDRDFVLPKLHTTETVVKNQRRFTGELFVREATTLAEQREERRLTMVERCEKVAELVAKRPESLAWCHMNAEADLLAELIPGAVNVQGSDSDEQKEEAFLAFANGDLKVLVSKPQIASFGLNFQRCAHMTFFPSHSFEQFYQGVRRCWRFGQKRQVDVDIISTEGEMGVLLNMKRKAEAAEQMFSQLVATMNNAMQIDRRTVMTGSVEVPSWV